MYKNHSITNKCQKYLTFSKMVARIAQGYLKKDTQCKQTKLY